MSSHLNLSMGINACHHCHVGFLLEVRGDSETTYPQNPTVIVITRYTMQVQGIRLVLV